MNQNKFQKKSVQINIFIVVFVFIIIFFMHPTQETFSRCPNGYKRSPIGDCEKITILSLADTSAGTKANFVTYENPTLRFKMQHPSDWELDESSVSDGIVRFKTSDRTLPIFIVVVKDVEQYLDTDTLTLKNTSLQQTVKEKQDFYSMFPTRMGIDYRPIRETDTTVGRNNATKLEFILGNNYQYEVYTIKNGKLYQITYEDTPGKVPERVKLANKVVESFQFT